MLAEEYGITKQGVTDKIKRLSSQNKQALPEKKMLIDNRETTFYYLTEDQIEVIKPKAAKYKLNSQASVQGVIQERVNHESIIDSQLEQASNNSDKPLEKVLSNESVLDFMREYAELRSKSDQVLLLTDKANELAGDKQFWQSKYFEIDKQDKLKDKLLIACLFVAFIFAGLFIYQMVKPPVIKEVTKIVYQPSKPLVQAKPQVNKVKVKHKKR